MTDNATFHKTMTATKEAFENHLYAYFCRPDSPYQKSLYQAMDYSLKAGGKRLRPVILIETAKVFGADAESVLAFASALEMIHTYSLIHDDLPAMDNDDLRRGKPTSHIVFGEATAILAGDALLNSAHTIMIDAARKAKDPQKYIEAAFEISSKAGAGGMIVGQVADIANENAQIDIETLNYINDNKTGALIEAAFVAGAILGGATENESRKMRKVAQNIGLSFQIIDDILDIEGDTQTIGKPAGSDAKNSKTTYPSLIGLEASRTKAAELTSEAIEILNGLSYKTDFLENLVKEMLSRKL